MINLDGLNPDQKKAVLTTDGPLMILAGAGSGKTRTLVHKIIYLLEDKKISPFKLLAMTFSNKAAREMRDRVAANIEMDIRSLQLTTFHSFCSGLLRNEAQYLGLSRNFTIYDDSESKAVMKSILAKRGISAKELPPKTVLYYIDELKNAGHYPGSKTYDGVIDTNDEYYSYYLEYEEQLANSNAVDFGGLIIGVLKLFENHPEVLERYQKRFDYILIDEYQDTNRSQFQLMKMLVGEKKNICVVGDEDQSIYSWRGADIRNILDFEKIFPEADFIKLEQNYRSSKTIIEAAGHVISHNEMRKGKNMWTDNDEGESISIIECLNDKSEALFITEKIKKLRKEGERLEDMAIFYRNNSQSRVIEDSLRKNQIPYRVVGGIKFYERKEVKDLLAYLRIIVNPRDSLAIGRIINVPARGIGATSLRKIEQEAVSADCSLWEIINLIVDNPESYKHLRLSKKIKSALSEFTTVMNDAMILDKNGAAPSDIYDKIRAETGYLAFLQASKDYESMARIENLEELYNAICQFEESQQKPTILGFLETITLDQSQMDSEEGDTGEVSLMTVHGSKGLEFQVVFLVGIEENLFPSIRSIESGEQGLEEERRLFYVAMTRAMKTLYITFAQGRMLFGNLTFNGPSRFIDEIPNKYYSWLRHGEDAHQKESYISDGIDYGDEFNQDTPDHFSENVVSIHTSTRSQAPKSRFPVGTDVIHSLYGKGRVVETDGHGQNEKVVILFTEGTRKKFLVKFAPIVQA